MSASQVVFTSVEIGNNFDTRVSELTNSAGHKLFSLFSSLALVF